MSASESNVTVKKGVTVRAQKADDISARVDTVVGALSMRRWARFMLRPPVPPPPHVSAASLDLFFEAERCFLRLAREVTSSEAVIPPALAHRLLAKGKAEETRVRSARSQLKRVASIAAAHGWPVVVLKGGVSVLEPGQALDMVDLDLLASSAAALELAAELDRVGYRASGSGSVRHLATRSIGAELPIDIHLTLSRNGEPLPDAVWKRLRPVASIEGLHTLAAADHLWHLLEHTVIDHPERMGGTRELLLLKSAASECLDSEWPGILARIEMHPKRSDFTDLLEAACGNADPSEWSLVDRASAVGYAARLVLGDAPIPATLLGVTYQWIFDSLLGGRAGSRAWEFVKGRPLGLSTIGPLAAVERRLPHLGRGVRVGARVLGVGAALMASLPIAMQVQGIAREVERRMDGAG